MAARGFQCAAFLAKVELIRRKRGTRKAFNWLCRVTGAPGHDAPKLSLKRQPKRDMKDEMRARREAQKEALRAEYANGVPPPVNFSNADADKLADQRRRNERRKEIR